MGTGGGKRSEREVERSPLYLVPRFRMRGTGFLLRYTHSWHWGQGKYDSAYWQYAWDASSKLMQSYTTDSGRRISNRQESDGLDGAPWNIWRYLSQDWYETVAARGAFLWWDWGCDYYMIMRRIYRWFLFSAQPLSHLPLAYTGCFTTIGHNCRRWFPRSLWWKKFI